MSTRLDRSRRALPMFLGVVTLFSVGLLLIWDDFPELFTARSHDYLAAFSLTMIAIAYLVYQYLLKSSREDMIKAIVLALAFLFWAANQMWPDLRQATMFNDIAIALFVLDVFCVIVGWPPGSPDSSFAQSYVDPEVEISPDRE